MKKFKSFAALTTFLAALVVMGAISVMAAPKFKANVSVNMPNNKLGTTVTVDAGVPGAGNNSGYQYKFVWSRNNWSEWRVLRNYSVSNKITFKPNKPGNYTVYVDVKDKSGNVASVSKSFTITLGWTPDLKITSWNVIGKPITATASVSGKANNMGYQYKFIWSRNNWQQWGVIQNFGSNNKISYTPTRAGTYRIYLDVKDTYGNIITRTATTQINLNWNPGLALNVPGSKPGTTVTAQGNISGLTADNPCRYKFVWSRNNWSEWGVISNFSSANRVSYKFTKNGNYEIHMDVKDKYGNVITRKSSFALHTDWKANAPSISMSGTKPGSKVTVTANTSMNVAGAKYKMVWSRDNWSDWGVIQNYSANRTANFYPSKPGNYTIYTDIIDSNGSVNTASRGFNIKSNSYKLIINLNTQTVHAMSQNADGSYTTSVRNMACSTGRSRGATPTGTYPLKTKYRWHQLMGGVYGQWCSRIVGGVLFHSVPYRSANNKTLITGYYNKLGSIASAGCVRLNSADAKWIYDNCPVGTPVQIGYYNAPNLPKAQPRRIKSSTNWDPTDPTLSSAYYNKGWQ